MFDMLPPQCEPASASHRCDAIAAFTAGLVFKMPLRVSDYARRRHDKLMPFQCSMMKRLRDVYSTRNVDDTIAKNSVNKILY